jgi:hypothetical protein
MAWMRERFPPLYALLLLPYYLMALLWVRLHSPERAVPSHSVAGFVAFWSFFLYLRVIDEHYDFEKDQSSHPDRPQFRGLVSLRELSGLGALALLGQGGWSLLIDQDFGTLTGYWVVLVIWSTLAGLEFFKPREWALRHALAFTTSHLLIMPLALFWVLLGLSRSLPAEIRTPDFYLDSLEIIVIAFLAGTIFEVTRKTWTPTEEAATDFTYSKAWGLRPTLIGLVIVSIFLSAIVAHLGHLRNHSSFALGFGIDALIVLSLGFFLFRLFRFSKTPSLHLRGKNEGSAAVLIMFLAWSLILRLI